MHCRFFFATSTSRLFQRGGVSGLPAQSATVPLGTPGRVRSICLLSVVFCLIFLLLRGPHAPHPFLVALLASPDFHTFCLFFSNLIFCGNWCQKLSKWDPQNNLKSQKSTKSLHQNASAIKACKKTLSGRGQTSEIEHSSKLLTLFTKAKGSQK